MFFITKENVPEGLGFSTFGVTHLIWLAAMLVIWILSVAIYRRLSAKNQNIMRICLGCAIIFLEILKDIVVAVSGDFGFGHLPFHLCGINILLISFDLIKKTEAVRNFLYFFCIPGAALALFFPNWTVLPCLNFYHIHSFLIHILLVMYPLLLVSKGEVNPKFKAMLKCIFLLICMAIPIYFINMLCDTNFMFLMDPETGNPLGLFEKYLGNHLWGFPILLPIVMLIMYIPLYILSKNKKSPRDNIINEGKQPQFK